MRKQQISDQKLISSYIAGNNACLEMLIKRHKNRIFTSIVLLVQDSYIAEDIFQETFIKVIKTLRSGKYNEEGKFLPWCIRIARNLTIDHFRKMKRMPKVTTQEGEDVFEFFQIEEENRETEMIREQSESGLKKLIMSLPKEQREVLILRHYSDMSFKEIAEMTGVSINTALGRMRYALSNLRKMAVTSPIRLR